MQWNIRAADQKNYLVEWLTLALEPHVHVLLTEFKSSMELMGNTVIISAFNTNTL